MAGSERASRLAVWWMVVVFLAAVAVWLAENSSLPWSSTLRALVHLLRVPALVALAVVIAATLALFGVRAALIRVLPEVADGEFVPAVPQLPACKARPPVLMVAGLEPGAGVSTIAFNLAILIAALGETDDGDRTRRPRPVCVLRGGALATALGLDPRALEEHMIGGPSRAGQGLLPFAVRHASGCELLCLSNRSTVPEHLWALVRGLRRFYDAVVIDAGIAPPSLANMAAEVAELLLLVGLPTPPSTEAAGLAADRVWTIRIEQRTVLIVNRVAPRAVIPADLTAGFNWRVVLPEQRQVPSLDLRAIPWVLDVEVAAARQLIRVGQRLVPALLPESVLDVV